MSVQGIDLEGVARELGEAASRQVDRVIFTALTNGTNVHYTQEDIDESGNLYICGEDCDGHQPSVSDPLAQVKCTCCEPHCRVKGKHTKPCYQPRLIDQQVADEIQLEIDLEQIEKAVEQMKRMGGWESETTEEEET